MAHSRSRSPAVALAAAQVLRPREPRAHCREPEWHGHEACHDNAGTDAKDTGRARMRAARLHLFMRGCRGTKSLALPPEAGENVFGRSHIG